jgi:hypothetical protein
MLSMTRAMQTPYMDVDAFILPATDSFNPNVFYKYSWNFTASRMRHTNKKKLETEI